MIYWSINAAYNSNCFEKIIVSTDDNEIADIAKEYGAEVPFKRPRHLADDYSNTIDVIKHSLSWIQKSELKVKRVCCIYATAPLINFKDILMTPIFINNFISTNKKLLKKSQLIFINS